MRVEVTAATVASGAAFGVAEEVGFRHDGCGEGGFPAWGRRGAGFGDAVFEVVGVGVGVIGWVFRARGVRRVSLVPVIGWCRAVEVRITVFGGN